MNKILIAIIVIENLILLGLWLRWSKTVDDYLKNHEG